jgi:hypothetical protein
MMCERVHSETTPQIEHWAPGHQTTYPSDTKQCAPELYTVEAPRASALALKSPELKGRASTAINWKPEH